MEAAGIAAEGIHAQQRHAPVKPPGMREAHGFRNRQEGQFGMIPDFKEGSDRANYMSILSVMVMSFLLSKELMDLVALRLEALCAHSS